MRRVIASLLHPTASCRIGAVAVLAAGLISAEPQGSAEYQQSLAQLEALTAQRDLELYELACEPLAMARILVPDRVGGTRLAHVLAFRIRNQVATSGTTPISQSTGYNQVLAAVAEQYSQAKVDKEQGVALRIDGVAGKPGVIVERQDAMVKTRNLRLTIIASDEHHTRLDQLAAASNDTSSFDFTDQASTTVATASEELRLRAEEHFGRRLLTLDEIAARQLPPYDPAQRGDEGWAVGEVEGVAVLEGIDENARSITIEIRGLSNKFRVRWPEQAAATTTAGVEDWTQARFLRRTYIVRYSRTGDEYYRDRDTIALLGAGWGWSPAFLRQDRRKTMAYSRYWLNHITNQQSDSINQTVEADFWQAYEANRAKAGERLPDLKRELETR